MIASLPMYWRPENADLWRAFWAEVQRAAPDLDLPDLTPPEDVPQPWTDHWLSPELALSMTCGLPFRTVLKDSVTYVGTLDFGLDNAPGHYRSTIIHRLPPDHPDLRSATRLAFNSADSQSGWAATQDTPTFGQDVPLRPHLETGSHAASLAAVAEGRADVAYLDAITWRLLHRFDPKANMVHVLGHSQPTPGLPLISAKGTDPEPLRHALRTAIASFQPQDPLTMGGPLGFTILSPEDYYAIPIPKPPTG